MKNKILLVDDDDDFRFALSEVIQMEGFDVISAKDLQGALKLLSSEKPDTIIVDYDLGETNGYIAASQIIQKIGKTPVIIISAHEAIEQEAKRLFKYFFEKPINFKLFFKTLSGILGDGKEN